MQTEHKSLDKCFCPDIWIACSKYLGLHIRQIANSPFNRNCTIHTAGYCTSHSNYTTVGYMSNEICRMCIDANM